MSNSQRRFSIVAVLVAAVLASACGREPAAEPDTATADTGVAPDTGFVTDTADAQTLDAAELDVAPVDAAAPACPGGAQCPCLQNADCDSVFCIEDASSPTGKACAQACVETCPAGYVCAQVAGAGADLNSLCVPTYGRLCDPCATSKDCQTPGVPGSACVDQGPLGRFCGVQCQGAGACPDGYACQPVTTAEGATAQQCVRLPDPGDAGFGACPCSPAATAQALSTACLAETKDAAGNVVGACPGTRTCGEAGLGACVAPPVSAEVCDGKDNDCDGQIDEASCDDGQACTFDQCDAAAGCLHKPLDGVACDADGSACTEADQCAAGACVAGKQKNCDDGNPCTVDACLLATGCTHTDDDGTPCDDDNPCTVGDTCGGGKCASGQGKDCSAGQACVVGACDLTDGKCKFKNLKAGTPCDDGTACTEADACADGACEGAAKVCDDANPCTNDACDKVFGCLADANLAPCDDGNACTDLDGCKGGKCVGLAKVVTQDCDDGNPCTDDGCDAQQGCTHAANTAGCTDGNACTDGDVCADSKCVPGQVVCGCQADADCAAKEDGDLCNGTLFCDKSAFPYACQVDAKTVVACSTAGDTSCQQAQCDAKTGQCGPVAVDEGKACDADGSVCSQDDVCAGGQCAAGKALGCDDGNACTDDACDPTLGCTHAANTAGCDADGDACTVADTCAEKVCVAGAAKACDDGKVCTVDGCDKQTGACTADAAALVGQPCDADGSVCTVADACSGGECQPGKALVCDDGNPCTDHTCDAKAGCKTTSNLAACDDGDACTKADQCDGGECEGKAVSCDDGDPCTADSCEKAKGCVATAVAEKSECAADGSKWCVGGKCVAKQVCGNGKVEGDEQCDDGNTFAADGCSAACLCQLDAAIRFAGNTQPNQAIAVPFPTELVGKATMTIEAIARLDSPSQYGSIIHQIENQPYLSYLGDIGYGASVGHWGGGWGTAFVKSKSKAAFGTWSHFAYVFDSGTLRFYVDGVLQATQGAGQGTVPAIKSAPTLYFGGSGFVSQPNANTQLNGAIRAVRISKTARYTTDFLPPATLAADGDGVQTYGLDEGGGVTAKEALSSQLDGQLKNGATWEAAGVGWPACAQVLAQPSCQAWLAKLPSAPDGVYPIDPDGPGPIPPANLFCDMKNGGWTLVGNFYDSAGDDMPNDTSFVVGGWQQTASGKWSPEAATVDRAWGGTTGSAAVSLAFVEALGKAAGQKHVKMCFVHKDGYDTTCRSSAAGSLTPVSHATGNPKLTGYKDDKLAYTFGRLAGLAGSVDGYDYAKYAALGYPILVKAGLAGEFGIYSDKAGLHEHSDGTYAGVWHANGCGQSFRPWVVGSDELSIGTQGACTGLVGEGPDTVPTAFGFRLYIGPDPVCGNGIVEGSEQCDDGNLVDGDGCAAGCKNEGPAWSLAAEWPLDAKPASAIVANGGFGGQGVVSLGGHSCWNQTSDWNYLWIPHPAPTANRIRLEVDVYANTDSWGISVSALVDGPKYKPDTYVVHGIGVNSGAKPPSTGVWQAVNYAATTVATLATALQGKNTWVRVRQDVDRIAKTTSIYRNDQLLGTWPIDLAAAKGDKLLLNSGVPFAGSHCWKNLKVFTAP